MPTCEAVHPYVPDPRLDWLSLDPESAELSRTCTGDFADPQMDREMRRFLWRDLMPTVMHTVAWCLYAVFPLALMALGLQETQTVDLVGALVALVIMSFALPMDVVAFFGMSRASSLKAATIRMAVAPLYGLAAAPRYLAFPGRYITLCGDQAAIHLDAANPNNTALIAAAVEDRQKYCIDKLDASIVALVCALVPIFRLYPQHAIPIICSYIGFYGVGFLYLRPSPEEARYNDNVEAIAANFAFQIGTIVTGVLLGYRLHATNRRRFIAAASGERVRLNALKELSEVDVLLRRTLPESALERVSTGAAVADVSSLATVLLSDLAGFTAWSSLRSAQQVVSMLNTLVTAFDGHLAGSPGVEKVKTIGDAYWAVAGLPEPVTCHASVMCRFALRMQLTLQSLAVAHAAEWGALTMRVGVHSGAARGGIFGTQRLSYEPFGEACDGAEEAEKRCPGGGSVCITAQVKDRLAVEAIEHGADPDSDALWASAADMDEMLKPLPGPDRHHHHHHDGDTGGGASYTLFVFPPIDGNNAESFDISGSGSRSPANNNPLHLALSPFNATEALSPMEDDALAPADVLGRVEDQRPSGDDDANPSHDDNDDVDDANLRTVLSPIVSSTNAAAATTAAAGIANKSFRSFRFVTRHQAGPRIVFKGVEDDDTAVSLEGEGQSLHSDAMAATLTFSHAADDVKAKNSRLEQRMRFVMKRAADKERRARQKQKKAAALGFVPIEQENNNNNNSNNNVDDDGKINVGGDDDDNNVTSDALAHLRDMKTGPFALATQVPLSYAFADSSEEAGYIQFARDATREMRRDVRIGTALLFFVTLVSSAATAGGNAIAVAVFGLAFAVAVINATLLVLQTRKADEADTVLSNLSFLVELVACYLADGNVVGNDPWWIFPVQTTFVNFTVYTLSPLSRTGLNTFFNFASFAKLAMLGKGDVQGNFAITFAGLVSLPPLTALIERFSRRAYVERRIAEALAAQEHAAKVAQTAMLENVVPRHAIAPLRTWLGQSFAPEHAIVQELPSVVVCFVKLHHGISTGSLSSAVAEEEEDEASSSWMLEAHRAADALLDRCVYVTKIKTIGQTLMLAGPFGSDAHHSNRNNHDAMGRHENARDDLLSASSSSSSADHPFNVNFTSFAADTDASLKRSVADIVFVVKSLAQLGVRVQAGVHVGSVAGAVLGTERLSYDILGDTVNTASRVTTGLSQFEEEIASPLPQSAVVEATPQERPESFILASVDVDDTGHSRSPTTGVHGLVTVSVNSSIGDGAAVRRNPLRQASPRTARTTLLRDNGSSLGFSRAIMRIVAPSTTTEEHNEALAAAPPTATGDAHPLDVSLPSLQLAAGVTADDDSGSSLRASLRDSQRANESSDSHGGGELQLRFMPKVFAVSAKGKGSLDVFAVEHVRD